MPASAKGRRISASPAMSTWCRRARPSCGATRPLPRRSPTGCLYGRGAADMKGAIACFTAAALDYVKSARPRARRLDLAAHHRRRGRAGDQRHAQGAGLDEGAGRAARSLPRRRAHQRQAHRRGDQDRPARQPERLAEGDRRARPRRLSASRQQSGQGPGEDPARATTTRRSITAARISRRPISK